MCASRPVPSAPSPVRRRWWSGHQAVPLALLAVVARDATADEFDLTAPALPDWAPEDGDAENDPELQEVREVVLDSDAEAAPDEGESCSMGELPYHQWIDAATGEVELRAGRGSAVWMYVVARPRGSDAIRWQQGPITQGTCRRSPSSNSRRSPTPSCLRRSPPVSERRMVKRPR